MTRFARAKGSKASNEKAPQDSTPWEVMKDQLVQAKNENEEAKKREKAEQQRQQNYDNFLKERRVQKRKTTWCDFPLEDDSKKKINSGTNFDDYPKEDQNKKKKKRAKAMATRAAENIKNSEKLTIEDKSEGFTKSFSSNDQRGETTTSQQKKKKKKLLKSNNDEELNSGKNDEIPKANIIKAAKGQIDKKEKKQESVNTKNNNVLHSKKKEKKKKKLLDGNPARRKPLNDRSFQLIINGKDVELTRFEGFPIMSKDAERLQELKDTMIKKGIPKSEVQRTIKLERRRAEKSLARLKRDVCYNCRKGGHNLSDCPELKSKISPLDAPEGICFKCGSTEHRQFECKVQKDQSFKFATCFICKEQGHIARQCPDNPKGLYPNGGGCKLCGDVTHLRKDCPTTKDKKEEVSFRLETLDTSENLEDIVMKNNSKSPEEKTKKPKKIKF